MPRDKANVLNGDFSRDIASTSFVVLLLLLFLCCGWCCCCCFDVVPMKLTSNTTTTVTVWNWKPQSSVTIKNYFFHFLLLHARRHHLHNFFILFLPEQIEILSLHFIFCPKNCHESNLGWWPWEFELICVRLLMNIEA